MRGYLRSALILRRRRSRRLEGWGGHRSRVYSRSAVLVCKSAIADLRCSSCFETH